jgi:UPF0755 protein
MKRALGIAAGMVLSAMAVVAFTLVQRYQGFQRETFVRFDRGTGTLDMGRTLAQAGVIRYPWQFWIERMVQPNAKLQAGEYRFQEPASVGDVFGRIVRGDVYFFEFTVPEGSNMFDIAHALEASGVMRGDEFLRVAGDPAPVRDLAPSAKTLEGYLFPSTYRLAHSTTAVELCRLMTEQFRKQWKKLAAGRMNVQEAVTLASLVEKETGVAEERPLVAGVFTNRLSKGMRLECDPTTIYAALLENRYRNAIHKSDLASQNPYNTYQHAGLPPGPIANPGAEAIQAALHPAETDYLYFVAKADGGGHQFSSSLAGHVKATQSYRKDARKKPRKAS